MSEISEFILGDVGYVEDDVGYVGDDVGSEIWTTRDWRYLFFLHS
jgi:hypothetical protein